MGRFLYWSDLHTEFEKFDIPVPGCQPGSLTGAPTREEIDGILIAGDTGVKGRHLDMALLIWDQWRCPVVMVDGNHESYGYKRIQKLWADEDRKIDLFQSAGADVHLLRPGVKVIGDTRIIGATLWTDLNLWGSNDEPFQRSIGGQMNDYQRCNWHDETRGIYRKMLPRDTMSLHKRDKDFILSQLDQPFDGSTIVMTHHVPVTDMVHPDAMGRKESVLAAYVSDLWGEIRTKPLNAWISGHTHYACDVTLEGDHGPVSFLSNPRGYPNEYLQVPFDPFRWIDTGAAAPEHIPNP